ncbi:uncharacterized protein B0T23DRAFT_383212 [Neurospora hispaniola]|uniref:Uncharacterized protein n=1 Tax=Neurospora hispaniola TaxID=588809 RepID=A0AAJ0I6S5_9PEZI|nr:hypothetical protein B0T23DRAFT_383212 [Neurospora hispaniola]
MCTVHVPICAFFVEFIMADALAPDAGKGDGNCGLAASEFCDLVMLKYLCRSQRHRQVETVDGCATELLKGQTSGLGFDNESSTGAPY